MSGTPGHASSGSKQKHAPKIKKETLFEWIRSFCFTRFKDESHQAWLSDAPAWIEALPFRAVFILLWNLLASSPLWAMYLTMCMTAMSLVAMVLQVVAMGMVNGDSQNTAGYWVFYIGSFGSPLFEAAWLLTQFLLGLAAEHVIATVRPARAREDAAQLARVSASPAAGGRSGGVRNPLDAPGTSSTALFPQLDLKNTRANGSVSSRASSASKGSSRRGQPISSPTAASARALVTSAVGADTVTLSASQSAAFSQLLDHKDSITAGFSVMLWLAWAVHISGLYVYSHACAGFANESEGVVSSATAFNCLELENIGDLSDHPVQRFAMVGQLLHALASCVMLLTLWAMPPKAPFTPHGMLKWGVLGFATVTFTQLAFAVLYSNESTSNKSWGETLAMFGIRVMSSIFAVLAVVALPPLSYLLSDNEEDEDDSKMKNLRLSAGRTPQDEYRARVSEQAMARLQEKQLNTCMHCSKWTMAVGLFTYMLVFVLFALLPLTGGTFALSWGRLGFFSGTGLSVYEVLLPLAIVSPLMLTIARSMFMALMSIHELCHRVHSSRAVYSWLAEYCLGCCCEVMCFACCCCYACCREERERVIRGKFNCPDFNEAWHSSPFLQCFGCAAAAAPAGAAEEHVPILGGQPSTRSTAAPAGTAQSQATLRKPQAQPSGSDADQPAPVAAAAGTPGSPVFVTEEEPTRVLKLLREGLSESDVLAGVTEKPKRGHLVRSSLQGLASKARASAGAGASAAAQREAAMQEAANGLSNLSVVDLLNDDQYHSLLKALLPEGATVYKGAPTAGEQRPGRALPTRRRKAASTPEAADMQATRSIVAADRSQIAWMPYSVWGFAVGCVLVPPLGRAMAGDPFFHYGNRSISHDANTFAETRFVLMLLLLMAYGARGAYSLRQTLRLLHRIRRVVEAAVSLDIHAMEWNFPYDMHGAAEWSARLLFASRFVGAQFTGPTAGFLSAWLLGTLLSAATLAILVLVGADWPHALDSPEFYAFGAVLVVYVGVGLFMLWQLLQTDDIIFGSIRDVSVLSARGGVVNTYRSLMAEYANSAVAMRSSGAAAGGSTPPPRDPRREDSLRAASFAQLLSITWQQRYPGIQILVIEGLEASRVTLSKASFRALVAGASVSGVSAVGRLLYARLTKQA